MKLSERTRKLQEVSYLFRLPGSRFGSPPDGKTRRCRWLRQSLSLKVVETCWGDGGVDGDIEFVGRELVDKLMVVHQRD